MPSQPTNAGIVTDENSGQRHIPESVRADGSTRKAIKIRPGYRPPEDVEVYKNRTVETFRNRYKGGVIGAEAAADPPEASSAANKNAKRREARKKAKEAETADNGGGKGDGEATKKESGDGKEPADPEVEREKKARNLKKKLKQARDLKDKKDGGHPLLPEQIAKVIKINELVRELAELGFDTEGEPAKKEGEDEDEEANEEEGPA